MARQMKAMVREEYGGTEQLRLTTLDVPELEADRVLVRVEASSVNPADRYYLLGTPLLLRPTVGWRRPRSAGFGLDLAGVVEAVGADVTDVAVGDRVVGVSPHSYAEYAAVRRDRLAVLPEGVATRDAALVPVAGATALQGIQRAGLRAGHRVLVNGASGGVGHLVVQLAVALGAEVTAVTSGRNVELVRSFGAHEVVDYTTTDITDLDGRFDVIYDAVGNHPARAIRELLVDDGVWVLVAGPMKNRVLGPIRYIAGAAAVFAVSSQRLVQFTAQENAETLEALVQHLADGDIVPHVERSYPLVDLADAITHLGTHRTRGKLLVEIG